MPVSALEDRVARLEVLVAKLSGSRTKKEKDWRRTLGRFTGDEIMKSIDREALRYRAADRKKARSTRRKSKSDKR